MLDPRVVGQEHYDIATRVQQILQEYKSLQDIEGDNLPEGAFYMVGDFASAQAKGEKIIADLEKS